MENKITKLEKKERKLLGRLNKKASEENFGARHSYIFEKKDMIEMIIVKMETEKELIKTSNCEDDIKIFEKNRRKLEAIKLLLEDIDD